MRNKNQSNQWPLWIGVVALCFLTSSCKPDDSPFKAENESLRKQLAKQESVVTSLQDGNKVMQQQIDLLNQELRDAKKSAESAKADAKAAADNLAIQAAQAKKLSADVQKTAAAQAAQNIQFLDHAAQLANLPIGALCSYPFLHNAIPPKVAEIDCIIDCKLRDVLVADNTCETLDHSFSGIAPYPELIRREI